MVIFSCNAEHVDELLQDFMAARPQDWPCADEAKVLDKIRSELEVVGRGAKVAQLLAEDCSSTAEEQRSSLSVRPELCHHCQIQHNYGDWDFYERMSCR